LKDIWKVYVLILLVGRKLRLNTVSKKEKRESRGNSNFMEELFTTQDRIGRAQGKTRDLIVA
jgi:hypothetical protein